MYSQSGWSYLVEMPIVMESIQEILLSSLHVKTYGKDQCQKVIYSVL